ncbi:helicase-related protein [Arcicella sp. DC2W]|uniref:Helicase-related protein n=1 Tax=Arcicella gelida TaxID=2984195 RepID=A0ABU5S3I7_9BACT|nr:helicase-related protein [Arcicella sp. DC2W]MEA5402798.1 helicase-related protein [Arcicella sp. DC2W]
MSYQKKQVLKDNLEGLKTAYQILEENRAASHEEKGILLKFKGWGGLKELLLPLDNISSWSLESLKIKPQIEELHTFLSSKPNYEQNIESIKNSILTSFYTSPELIQSIGNALQKNAVKADNYLDPSAGSGLFFSEFQKLGIAMKDSLLLEKDDLTAKILKALHPTSVNAPFETVGKHKMGTYDLISSNIPFGDFKVFDPIYNLNKNKVKRQASNHIHNFFLIKSLDLLKEGGVLAHIMPYGVLDSPAHLPIRQFVMANANLISAIRLPQNTFLDAGTQAGADLLILQKTGPKTSLNPMEQSLVRTSLITNEQSSHKFQLNEYFHLNRNAIISDELTFGKDQYGRPNLAYLKAGGLPEICKAVDEILASDFKKNFTINLAVKSSEPSLFQATSVSKKANLFQLDLFAPAAPVNPIETTLSITPALPKNIPYKTPLTERDIDGQFVVENDKIFKLKIDVGANYLVPTDYTLELQNMYLAVMQIRKTYDDLYRYELAEKIEHSFLRKSLNDLYDNFKSVYGSLNSNRIYLDEDPKNKQVFGLERVENKEFVKSDIFHKPVGFNQVHEYSVKDAFYVSLNQYGFADTAYIAKLSQHNEATIEQQLLAEKLIAFNPKTARFEGFASVISGNVVEKINWLENNLPNIEDQQKKERLQHTLDCLKEVLPAPISYNDLDFNLGERWISPKIYERFARQLFNSSSITVDYLENTDNYMIRYQKYERNENINTLYAVTADNNKVNGIDLLEHALYNTTPKMEKLIGYDADRGKNIYVTDKDKTILVNNKIEDIRNKFVTFLNEQDIDFKNDLAKTYNQKFNCYVKPQYDGGHLTFPQLNLQNLGIPDLYKSQKDAAWALIQQDGGIVDHQVGLGKSLTMIVTSHEMKRLGVANKPLILCLKANIAQIAETYKKAYPDASLLYSGDVDFSKKNRENIFNQIKNNNWDCVILTHEQFSKIPHSHEAFSAVLGDELNNLNKDLKVMNTMSQTYETKQQYKGLLKRQANLESKLKTKMEAIKEHRDDVLNFDSMGIDHIFVDESHIYKNLTYSTRHNNVAGLGSMEGSDRALNMLVALRTLQEKKGKDLGVTFLSGTPISNSLNELYLLFKYLRPKELKKQQIFNFDSWIATYGVKSTEYEISITNNIIQKERFREYIKVPELAIFYSQITDYKTSDMVGIFPAKAKTELVVLPQTKEQQDFSLRLQDFANSGDGTLIYRNPLSESEEKAKMLIATNESKKMALDMRLIHPSFNDDVNNKINQCCHKVLDYYREGNHFKATQMIFCDLSTPSSKSTGFNVYFAIKDKLIEKGLKPEEVAFIQSFKTDKQREKLFEKMNNGEVRVLIGSTSTLGTGVNAQRRMIAMHHLDIPWKPSEFEQRIGRGARQGNEYAMKFNNNEVHNFVYAVEQTLDSYKFNLLLNKSIFINQIKSNQLGVRKIDEGGMDEANGMNYAEYCAILSGNTLLLDKAKLERELGKVESEKFMFLKDQRLAEEKIEGLETSLRLNEIKKEALLKDQKFLLDQQVDFNSEKVNLDKYLINSKSLESFITRHSDSLFDKKELDIRTEKGLGSYLVKLRDSISQEGITEVGTYAGFKMYFEATKIRDFDNRVSLENILILQGQSNEKYAFNSGYLARTPDIAVQYPQRALLKIPVLLESVQQNIENINKNINDLRKFIQEDFKGEYELIKVKKELDSLIEKIDQTIEKKEKSINITPSSNADEQVVEMEKKGMRVKI